MKRNVIYTTHFGNEFYNFDLALEDEIDYFKRATTLYNFEGENVTEEFYAHLMEVITEDEYVQNCFNSQNDLLVKEIAIIKFDDEEAYKAFTEVALDGRIYIEEEVLETENFYAFNTKYIGTPEWIRGKCYTFLSWETINKRIDDLYIELDRTKKFVENIKTNEREK